MGRKQQPKHRKHTGKKAKKGNISSTPAQQKADEMYNKGLSWECEKIIQSINNAHVERNNFEALIARYDSIADTMLRQYQSNGQATLKLLYDYEAKLKQWNQEGAKMAFRRSFELMDKHDPHRPSEVELTLDNEGLLCFLYEEIAFQEQFQAALLVKLEAQNTSSPSLQTVERHILHLQRMGDYFLQAVEGSLVKRCTIGTSEELLDTFILSFYSGIPFPKSIDRGPVVVSEKHVEKIWELYERFNEMEPPKNRYLSIAGNLLNYTLGLEHYPLLEKKLPHVVKLLPKEEPVHGEGTQYIIYEVYKNIFRLAGRILGKNVGFDSRLNVLVKQLAIGVFNDSIKQAIIEKLGLDKEKDIVKTGLSPERCEVIRQGIVARYPNEDMEDERLIDYCLERLCDERQVDTKLFNQYIAACLQPVLSSSEISLLEILHKVLPRLSKVCGTTITTLSQKEKGLLINNIVALLDDIVKDNRSFQLTLLAAGLDIRYEMIQDEEHKAILKGLLAAMKSAEPFPEADANEALQEYMKQVFSELETCKETFVKQSENFLQEKQRGNKEAQLELLKTLGQLELRIEKGTGIMNYLCAIATLMGSKGGILERDPLTSVDLELYFDMALGLKFIDSIQQNYNVAGSEAMDLLNRLFDKYTDTKLCATELLDVSEMLEAIGTVIKQKPQEGVYLGPKKKPAKSKPSHFTQPSTAAKEKRSAFGDKPAAVSVDEEGGLELITRQRVVEERLNNVRSAKPTFPKPRPPEDPPAPKQPQPPKAPAPNLTEENFPPLSKGNAGALPAEYRPSSPMESSDDTEFYSAASGSPAAPSRVESFEELASNEENNESSIQEYVPIAKPTSKEIEESNRKFCQALNKFNSQLNKKPVEHEDDDRPRFRNLKHDFPLLPSATRKHVFNPESVDYSTTEQRKSWKEEVDKSSNSFDNRRKLRAWKEWLSSVPLEDREGLQWEIESYNALYRETYPETTVSDLIQFKLENGVPVTTEELYYMGWAETGKPREATRYSATQAPNNWLERLAAQEISEKNANSSPHLPQ